MKRLLTLLCVSTCLSTLEATAQIRNSSTPPSSPPSGVSGTYEVTFTDEFSGNVLDHDIWKMGPKNQSIGSITNRHFEGRRSGSRSDLVNLENGYLRFKALRDCTLWSFTEDSNAALSPNNNNTSYSLRV